MKLKRNYTMESPNHYNKSNGFKIINYRGNKFWVMFNFIATDENGRIYSYEKRPRIAIDKWEEWREKKMAIIGVASHHDKDWRETLEEVLV